jgi:hypothetical protein
MATFLSLVSGVAGYLLNAHSGKLWDMHRDEVEEVIQGWLASRLAPVRMGAKGVGHLVRYIWLRSAPGMQEAVGYPGAPQATPTSGDAQDTTPIPLADDILATAPRTLHEGEQVPLLSTPIVVVGSGSGACAFTSSFIRTITDSPSWRSRPADMLILERGNAYAPRPNGRPIPAGESDAMDALFEKGGVCVSEESAISFATASTLGGGSRINWSACLQTDRKVREEWTRHMHKGAGGEADGEAGRWADMFLGAEWQDCLDT